MNVKNNTKSNEGIKDMQNAIIDIRVINPLARSYRDAPIVQCHHKQEQKKQKVCKERAREIEHGSISPLVFSTTGGMGLMAQIVYKQIVSLIADKQDKPYCKVNDWIRCKISFSLL